MGLELASAEALAFGFDFFDFFDFLELESSSSCDDSSSFAASFLAPQPKTCEEMIAAMTRGPSFTRVRMVAPGYARSR